MHNSSFKSCDLLSNFVTYTYLQLLEHYFLYTKHPTHKLYKQKLLRSISSYLFIIQHDSKALDTLNQHIFSYYTPPNANQLPPFFKKNKSLGALRRTYHKKRLTLDFNKLFVGTYHHFIFASYPKVELIPSLFIQQSAETFTNHVYHLKDTLQ